MTRLAAAASAGALTALAWQLRDLVPTGDAFHRVNHRGETVTMWEGPAWSVGVVGALLLPGTRRSRPAGPVDAGLTARTRAALAAAVGGAAVFGVVDDLTETGRSKGLKGHLGALRRGEVTTGALKIAGIGGCSLLAGLLILTDPGQAGRPDATPGGLAPRPRLTGPARLTGLARLADIAVAGGVIAGTANLLNLLDLRPGRALKVVLAASPVAATTGAGGVAQAAASAASLVLLRPDLAEECMLGDCGANAAGALLGAEIVLATVGRPNGRLVRALTLVGLVGLTVASEKVSFTRVIESTPVLRDLDRLGRRPAATPASQPAPLTEPVEGLQP